jgi:hypothetical protein
MYSRLKSSLVNVLIWICFVACNSTSESPTITVKSNSRFDSVIHFLRSKDDLKKEDLLVLNIIDTNYLYPAGETSYIVTTRRLNDSISWSIIELNDTLGICGYPFIVTINEYAGKAVDSYRLGSNCNIDFSMDIYDLSEYSVTNDSAVKIIETTIFQKKNRTSSDDEENIDRKETKESYIAILPNGKIYLAKSGKRSGV